MQDTFTSRLLYKGRSYLRTLQLTFALFSKYTYHLCRSFAVPTLLLSLLVMLPLGVFIYAVMDPSVNPLLPFLCCLCFFLLVSSLVLLFRAGGYAYFAHYFSLYRFPQSFRKCSSKLIGGYAARLLVVNTLLRFPYVAAVTLLFSWISTWQSLVLSVVVLVGVGVLSLYLHVVNLFFEFSYVYEHRTLPAALKLAFKQGTLRWGSLFLVSFFAEAAACLLALCFTGPFLVILLAADNAYTLQILSQESQSVPTIAYILLPLCGAIALAGQLLASLFPLCANILQCGSVVRKNRLI